MRIPLTIVLVSLAASPAAFATDTTDEHDPRPPLPRPPATWPWDATLEQLEIITTNPYVDNSTAEQQGPAAEDIYDEPYGSHDDTYDEWNDWSGGDEWNTPDGGTVPTGGGPECPEGDEDDLWDEDCG